MTEYEEKVLKQLDRIWSNIDMSAMFIFLALIAILATLVVGLLTR